MTEHPNFEFEIIYRSGHIERIHAAQCLIEGRYQVSLEPRGPVRYVFHGEVGGCWCLVLDVLADDVLSVRNLTATGAGGQPNR